MSYQTVAWEDNQVVLIDQRVLPEREEYLRYSSPGEVKEAIRSMVVRGAPAIGVTAAYGMVLGAMAIEAQDRRGFLLALEEVGRDLEQARPTAVNLAWAIDRIQTLCRAREDVAVRDLPLLLLEEARRIHEEDLAMCKAMGRHGAMLLPKECGVLTHCNAGGLATAGYGTALGVIKAAHEMGKKIHVYADETRPFLQGARLTAWELQKEGVPVTVICDNMAAAIMATGDIQAVVVGSDRIAANGDVANKIGTYGVAVLAKAHQIPFYVAAPTSTVDLATPSGQGIPIEERDPDEVIFVGCRRAVPVGVGVRNPAFDVTPAPLVAAIITEQGVARPPFKDDLARMCAQARETY